MASVRRDALTPGRSALACGAMFLAIGLPGINAEFTSAFHERQYQTVEMGQSLLAGGGATVWSPRVPIANAAQPELGYTTVRLEFPLHAALGAPVARIAGDRPWVWRSISILASLVLIVLASCAFDREIGGAGGAVATALFA